MSGKFEMGDYVEVKDRIRLFYERYPDGRLVTGDVRVTSEPDGVPRVWVEALAFRTADDPHPTRGWSWMQLPGSTPYTRGSEIENAETSAWGRAIGAQGIGIDKSVASAQEVRNKAGEAKRPTTAAQPAPARSVAPAGSGEVLVGIARKGSRDPNDQMILDGQLRETPDGGHFGFLVDTGEKKRQVVLTGAMALGVASFADEMWGQEVTVIGPTTPVPWTKDGKQMPPYPRWHATKVSAPGFTIPGEGGASAVFPASDDDELDQITAAL